jgi:hypothetical protein
MARRVRSAWGLASALFAGANCVLSACGSDLGKCDMTAATVLVYRGGVPHYEGQALVESRCAGGFCHSASAMGASRFGVPAELDFDVPVVTAGHGLADVERHRKGLAAIGDFADEMFSQVEAGTMPPGAAGRRDPGVWLHADASGNLPTGGFNELVGIETKQGQEVLRNWLACGHPTVTGTDDLEPGVAAAVTGLGGTVLPAIGHVCAPTAAGALAPVLAIGGCTACHNDNPDLFGEHMLDLSGSTEMAHAALFEQPARGKQCGTSDLTLIVPRDCEGSLLYQKLATMPPTPPGPFEDPTAMPADTLCGDIMPPGRGAFVPEFLDCLCQWIAAGAPLN